MELFIYDQQMDRLGTIDNFSSLTWTRKYYECGEMELHCPVTEENIRLLKPGNLVTKQDRKEAAVIRGDQIIEESRESNAIIIKGYFLPIYLNDRLTGPMVNFNGTAEEALRFMLKRVSPIPMMDIAEPIGDAAKIRFQATYKSLLAVMSKICRAAELGMKVTADFRKKKMTFESYKGVDRSFSQNINPRVIFSEAYENLNNARYTYSDHGLVTKVVVGGAGEGEERVFVSVGGGEGFGLIEKFYDARNISNENMEEIQYIEELKAAGLEYLSKHSAIENFETEVSPDKNFVYRKDYDLGDVVTIKKEKWGKATYDLRITEICEVYEGSGMFIVPTFGHPLPVSLDFDE
ncbi:MAG: siphovirus ReqiPepy6 Gp37-like family protein [Lachnospiraceae bacterium]|nr:siphovirus ReqiPepy6 Gp37-like family protein [Lachnospiraceae bacterium]